MATRPLLNGVSIDHYRYRLSAFVWDFTKLPRRPEQEREMVLYSCQ